MSFKLVYLAGGSVRRVEIISGHAAALNRAQTIAALEPCRVAIKRRLRGVWRRIAVVVPPSCVWR
ncbi:MAG: hypothetical protein K2P78_07985 [Gemmataceae bacterium]|nr:hypothetical protein [Gemmataceae bacterium]